MGLLTRIMALRWSIKNLRLIRLSFVSEGMVLDMGYMRLKDLY